MKEDRLFDEIDKLDYRDYKGKFVVFYKKERAGRVFDFYEGGEKKYTFDFGDGDEITTDKFSDIDTYLLAMFTRWVSELDVTVKPPRPVKVS